MSAQDDQYGGAERIVADMRPKPPCVRGRCAMAKDGQKRFYVTRIQEYNHIMD